jgi:hypothetical protein
LRTVAKQGLVIGFLFLWLFVPPPRGSSRVALSQSAEPSVRTDPMSEAEIEAALLLAVSDSQKSKDWEPQPSSIEVKRPARPVERAASRAPDAEKRQVRPPLR